MDVKPSKRISPTKIEVLARLQRLEASEETWLEIQRRVYRVLAEQVTELADKIAEEKGWTDEDFERMAHTHMRTPYVR